MGRKVNLTEGPIIRNLVKLAMPIMGTSFIQMAYNLTDMIWIGKWEVKRSLLLGRLVFLHG